MPTRQARVRLAGPDEENAKRLSPAFRIECSREETRQTKAL
jgi:hypothetical protein